MTWYMLVFALDGAPVAAFTSFDTLAAYLGGYPIQMPSHSSLFRVPVDLELPRESK